MKNVLTRGLAAATCATALACAATASATPVTVNLRVEGSAQTVYEGTVTTDARTITANDGTPHPCTYRDNGSNTSFDPTGGTPTTALYDLATAQGLPFGAQWYDSPT